MNKRYIVALLLGALASLISACQNKVLEVPEIKNPSIPGFIKEMRITRPGDSETEIIKVTYDESNRVNSLFYSYYGEDSYTISYGTNKVVLKRENGVSSELSANSDGFVTKMENSTYSYSGRNIISITQPSMILESVTDGDGKEVTTFGSTETTYSWENGNLTKRVWKLSSENEERIPSETSITSYSYHQEGSNPFYQKGIDPFMILSGDRNLGLGLFGDSSKHLMTGYNDNIIEISNTEGKPEITHIRVRSKDGTVADCSLSY